MLPWLLSEEASRDVAAWMRLSDGESEVALTLSAAAPGCMDGTA